jgi:hypothetical protein
MPLSDVTRESILAVIQEHDRLGPDPFLKRYRLWVGASGFLYTPWKGNFGFSAVGDVPRKLPEAFSIAPAAIFAPSSHHSEAP